MCKIEIFSITDYEKIRTIQRENMEQYTIQYFWTNWKEDRFKNRYDEILKKWFIFSIKLDALLIWFFMIVVSDDHYVHIKELQIDRLYQSKWYWTFALEFIEDFSKKILATWMRLSVFKDNPAISLYSRKWFSIVQDRFEWKAYYMEKNN